MLDILEFAVMTMKNAAPAPHLEWEFWARMHGSDHQNTLPFGQCIHESWWFLPWHRAFLVYFERAVRQVSGKPEFTLPYWRWDSDSAGQLPARFCQQGSGLRIDRNVGGIDLNSGDFQIPSFAIDVRRILDDVRDFSASETTEGFGGRPHPVRSAGRLEGGPHDGIHGCVLGPMQATLTAAEDPIFWLHHCNIDRLWDEWLLAGNDNPPDDSPWMQSLRVDHLGNPGLGKFPNGNGDLEDVTTAQVVTPGDHYDYTYDSIPDSGVALLFDRTTSDAARMARVERPPRREPELIRATRSALFANGKVLTLGVAPVANLRIDAGPVRVPLRPPPGTKPSALDQAVEVVSKGGGVPTAIQIIVNDVSVSTPPGVVLRVFLNQPDASASTDPGASNYIGFIPVFLRSPHHHDEDNAAKRAGAHRFDVTRTVQRLAQSGRLNIEQMELSIVPVGPGRTKPDVPIQLGSIEMRIVQQ